MTLKELEQQVALLPPEKLAEFRDWFLRFDVVRWDPRDNGGDRNPCQRF